VACYHPLQAFRSKDKNANGKSTVKFNMQWGSSSVKFEPIKVSCGRCIGCRLERSRQWAIRCMHESTLYPRNCFITLTYNPKSLPKDGSLQLRHFQLFLKRLRKKFGEGIRFFHCGEYGENNFRPHYHACLFNHDFTDKVLWKDNNGIKLYVSQSLNDLWSDPDTGESYGFTTLGDVTFESAAYVARYITKKINGEKAEAHYQGKKPEYITMSRGSSKLKTGGIGKGWYDKFKSDCYPSDFLVHRDRKMLPPKYYDKLFEVDSPEEFAKVKLLREEKAKMTPLEERSPERLKIKEIVKKSHNKQLKRRYETNDT